MTLRRDNDPKAQARREWRQKHPVLSWLSKLDVYDWQIYGGAVLIVVVGLVYLLIELLFQ